MSVAKAPGNLPLTCPETNPEATHKGTGAPFTEAQGLPPQRKGGGRRRQEEEERGKGKEEGCILKAVPEEGSRRGSEG